MIKRRLNNLIRHPIKSSQFLFAKVRFFLFGKSTNIRCKLFFGDKIVIPAPCSTEFCFYGMKYDKQEVALTKYILSYLKHGDIFFDIGAHIGFYSLLANNLGAKVYSFEPNPEIFPYLVKNTWKKNIETKNVAVSNVNGFVDFLQCDNLHSELSGIKGNCDIKDKNSIKKSIQVRSIKLDSLGVIPKFIKIDAEGSQYKILSSYEKVLLNNNITISSEYDGELSGFMKKIGYKETDLYGISIFEKMDSS